MTKMDFGARVEYKLALFADQVRLNREEEQSLFRSGSVKRRTQAASIQAIFERPLQRCSKSKNVADHLLFSLIEKQGRSEGQS